MGLTYRKNLGRPLTSDEIDANFEFFTSSLGGATTGSNTFVGNQIITGSILISGSIVPAVGVGQTTSSFDLGSPTAAWKDIYVSEGSIKFIKSGSASITLSAKDGGIQINGGSTISADGVSGQFITSKSLSDNITVKDSNNSLLMGPIEVETDTEIIVEEDSDLTIFGDIEIQNVAFAVTASYALNAPSAFPYSGSAVISGSLVVNNGTNNVINTSNYQLLDSNGTTSVDWQNKVLKLAENRDTVDWGGARLNDYTSEALSVDWEGRILYDISANQSIDWQSRIFYANDGTTAHLDWSNPSYMQLTSISGSPIANVLGIDSRGRLYYTASSAVGGSTPNLPGGVEGSIQFNNSIGDFGGTQKFTYNASSHSISLTEFIPAPFGITENKGQYSILQGREGKVLGDYGVSLVGAYALDTASVAIGYGVIASGSYQVAVGRQNASNNTSSIFIVGVGSGKDGFTVEADASIRAHVTIPVNSTNPTNPKSGSMYVFESGSNYYINVYVGGRWRSASLF